jgi:hypothetical protein
VWRCWRICRAKAAHERLYDKVYGPKWRELN